MTPEEVAILTRAAEAGAFSQALRDAADSVRVSDVVAPIATALLGREVPPHEVMNVRGSFYDAVWLHYWNRS